MEIERKFLLKQLPENLDQYPFHIIEQGYLNTDPAIRVRKQTHVHPCCVGSVLFPTERSFLPTCTEHAVYVHPCCRTEHADETYSLTYKASGFMAREEYNLPLTKKAYEHLIQKTDGNIIRKKRYLIPLTDSLTIELDQFYAPHSPLVLAEVEFSCIDEANSFVAPDWFGEDVTYQSQYHNSHLCMSVPI